VAWFLTLAPIFGPAAAVFAVYAYAKRRPIHRTEHTYDARPYDDRRLMKHYKDRARG
jgi:hypothetical protein